MAIIGNNVKKMSLPHTKFSQWKLIRALQKPGIEARKEV
jgi:hypothetical protein